MNPPRRVAAVVVNFASWRHLDTLLSSLATEPVGSILVWDNYSTDGERDALRVLSRRYPSVSFHECPENLGFGAGVNAAVDLLSQEGEFDYFWILNPDVVVRAGALDRLLDSAMTNGCSIISPAILIADTGLVWYAGGAIRVAAGRSVHDGIGKEIDPSMGGFKEVTFVTGAAPLIRAEAWRQLRGFDERYFLYCEDADLSIRATELGLVQGVELGAIVEHDEGGSSGRSGGRSPTFYYYVQRNRLLLYGKSRSKLSLLLGQGLAEAFRLTLLTLRPLDRDVLKRFSASLAGVAAGLAGEHGKRNDRGWTRVGARR